MFGVNWKLNIKEEDQGENYHTKIQIKNFNSVPTITEDSSISRINGWVSLLIKHEAGLSDIQHGRPSKEFKELTASSKFYLHWKKNSKEKVILRLTGQRDAANLVREVTETSPKRATKIKKSWKCPPLNLV